MGLAPLVTAAGMGPSLSPKDRLCQQPLSRRTRSSACGRLQVRSPSSCGSLCGGRSRLFSTSTRCARSARDAGLDELSMQEASSSADEAKGGSGICFEKNVEENTGPGEHTRKSSRERSTGSRASENQPARVSGREQIDRTWAAFSTCMPNGKEQSLIPSSTTAGRRFVTGAGCVSCAHAQRQAIAYRSRLSAHVYGIKTTYNPSYYAYSPGVLLFTKSSRHVQQPESGSSTSQGRRAVQARVDILHPRTGAGACYPRNMMWKTTPACIRAAAQVEQTSVRCLLLFLRRLLAKNSGGRAGRTRLQSCGRQ